MTEEQVINQNVVEISCNDEKLFSSISDKTKKWEAFNHHRLLTAHGTVRNILECVGKKADVSRCTLFQIIDNQWVVAEHEWPRKNRTVYFAMPAFFKEIEHTSPFVVKQNDPSINCEDLHFFELNETESFLLLPIGNLMAISTASGLLAFSSNIDREWTHENRLLLELARDLIKATMMYPHIFINLDHKIDNLPDQEIDSSLSNEQHAIIDRIVLLFEQIRRRSKIQDLWESSGIKMFKSKLARFVLSNQTINMALPGFPFKNRDRNNKVIGALPDMGEVLALSNLNAFALQVGEVYPPGCKILMISDGRVFNDLYPVSDVIVSDYMHNIHSLEQSQLQFIGLDQLFSSLTENQFKRDAIIRLYDGTLDSVKRKLKEDVYFHQIYIAFKILLRKDICEPKRTAAEKAKVMMLRNDSYSALIRILFPHHLRLSIHDHSSLEKISVHLIGDSIITPWHGVAVKRKDGTWAIMRKKMALEMGCVLDDAMSPENRKAYLLSELKSFSLQQTDVFTSLPFYREV